MHFVGACRPPRRPVGRSREREPLVVGVDHRRRDPPSFALPAHRHRLDPDLVRVEHQPIEVPGRAQVVDLGVLERRIIDVTPECFATVTQGYPRHERGEPCPPPPARGRIVVERGGAVGRCDEPVDVERRDQPIVWHRDREAERWRDRRRVEPLVRHVVGLVAGGVPVVGRLGARLSVCPRREHREQDEHRDDDQRREPRRLVACSRCGAYGPNVSSPLTENAMQVLRARYLARDGGVVVETPEQMFARVARHVAAVEARFGASPDEVAAIALRFERRLAALEFLPNSPTLMNAGRPLGQLAACFVVPVDDSTTGVFEAVRWAAEIQKTGGGTGFSFSRLRPAGDLVASTGGTASGPVTLMQVFDVATEAIKQGGTRRGANMGMLRVDHPDILEFIAIKLDPTRMRNFNLSVAATDAFMRAVAAGTTYELVNPRTEKVTGRLDARRVFDAIANAAWAVGDPGLVFIDRIDELHPTPDRGVIEATNPCGEQPLLPFESCTLGSIDVGRFVGASELDWDRLREVIHEGVRFLDDVIDANRYPLVEIERATKDTRKIGLGLMGWADALVALNLAYDSEPALELAGKLARFLEDESLRASEALAASRGPFPAWAGSRWERQGQRPLRNATTTTIAPTGTISIIAGCASGIEPLYALAYRRNVLDGAQLDEVNPAFQRIAAARGIATPALFASVAEHGGVRGIAGVPADVQRLFPTAHDVSIDVHVRMQAAFQRYVHAAVSKTINLRREATPLDVKAAYRLAYELGCKGITVYRDGSREGQVLVTGARPVVASTSPGCPECGSVLVMQARCQLCRHCGWSVCSV